MKMNHQTKTMTASITAAIMLFGSVGAVLAANVAAPAVADGFTRYEAEEAKLVNGANNASFNIEHQDGQSGSGVYFIENNSGRERYDGNVVGNLTTKAASALNYDFSNTGSVQFTVEREEAGMVEVVLGFRSSQESDMAMQCGNIPIKCNDGSIKEAVVSVPADAEAPAKQASVYVDMRVGTNIVYVAGPVTAGGWINLDYIDVSNYTDVNASAEPEETEATPMPVSPLIKSIYTADPSAHVWSSDPNTLYVYPSHDRYPQVGCDRMDAYHIYSTTNMVDFTDCGEIFGAYDLEWGREAFSSGKFDDGTFMWAPDAAYSEATGKYYYYYPRPADETRKEWRVGVAVSDYPDHGFVDVGIPISGIGGSSMIDPAVFTDDDGTSYLYLGGGGNEMGGCAVAKLNPDMVTLAEEPHIMYTTDYEDGDTNGGIPDYHEGPYVVKRDGIYYLLYADGYKTILSDGSTGAAHNRQRYVYSTAGPEGPWVVPTTENTKTDEPDGVYGVVLDPESSDTSHGSIVGFKDKWYMFYHTMDLSGNGALRSVQADEVTFAADGSINKVVQTDGSGLLIGERETRPEPDSVYEAENANYFNETSDLQPAAVEFTYHDETVTAVTNLMIPGAAVVFEGVDGGNGGRANITFRYSAVENGYIKLNVNGRDYSFINLIGTGGKSFFSGESNITVFMNPGTDNVITLTEANKTTSLDKIEIRNMD